MEKSATTNHVPAKVPPAAMPEEQPFYGWRYTKHILPDGKEVLDRRPLTLEEVLHPQESDEIPERPIHERDRGYLASAIRAKNAGRRGFQVFSDCLVDWGVPGLANTSPDVSVFEGLKVEHDPDKGTFHLAPSGGRCLLATEIVSPDTRVNDVTHKPDEYQRAGVPLYVIVDQERVGGPRSLRGYRNTAAGFKPMIPDDQGRLFLETVGLWIGLRDNRVICFDGDTGEEIGDYVQVDQARRAAEERERKEADARRVAEQRERKEAEARRAAEDRVRELEAELRRLQERK